MSGLKWRAWLGCAWLTVAGPAHAVPPEAVTAPPGAIEAACTNQAALMQPWGAPFANLRAEVERIRRWVDACSRAPRPDERVLYTWGHERKLLKMLTMDRLLFAAYDTARQQFFNQLQFESSLLGAMQSERNELFRQARQLRLQLHYNNFEILANELGRTSKSDVLRRDALQLAAFDMWLPGLLHVLSLPAADRRDLVVSRFREAPLGSVRHARALGMQEAFEQFQQKQASSGTNFPSSSSYGWSVYFSNNAVRYVNHLYDPANHMGVICRLPADPHLRPILDLTDTRVRPVLKRAKVLWPDDMPGLFAKNYSYFLRPEAADEALRQRIVLGTEAIYSEKALFDARFACEPITLSNFPCNQWSELLLRTGDLDRLGRYFRRQWLLEFNQGRPPSEQRHQPMSDGEYTQAERRKTEECSRAAAAARGS